MGLLPFQIVNYRGDVFPEKMCYPVKKLDTIQRHFDKYINKCLCMGSHAAEKGFPAAAATGFSGARVGILHVDAVTRPRIRVADAKGRGARLLVWRIVNVRASVMATLASPCPGPGELRSGVNLAEHTVWRQN
jgi:hypothetical protein